MKERTAVGEIRRTGAARARPTGHASLCSAVIFAAVSETKEAREAGGGSRPGSPPSITEPNATATRSIAMNDIETAESRLSEDFRDFVKLKVLDRMGCGVAREKLEDRRATPIKTNCGDGCVECSLRFAKSQLHKACDFPALMVLRCDAMRCDAMRCQNNALRPRSDRS